MNCTRASALIIAFAFFSNPYTVAREISPHARQAVEIIRQLRAIPLPDFNQNFAEPPAKVPELLRQLNQQLKALILEEVSNPDHAVPGSQEIFDQLRAAGWEQVANHEWNAYGEIERISFDWQTGYDPGLLVVTTNLWVPCGSADPDAAIYVFQGAAPNLKLIIATDADFDSLSESSDDGMRYKISPPNSDGRWFLAIAHVPPSCLEGNGVRWNANYEFHYKILRPGISPESPTVVITRSKLLNHEFQPSFRLDVWLDWFAITRGYFRKFDDQTGVAISRYHVDGSKVQRIAPLALTPEDFLDQWSDLNWDEARNWISSTVETELTEWHEKLHQLQRDSVDIESVHRCSGSDDADQTWLLELAIDRKLNPRVEEDTLFVDISKRNGIFRVEAFHTVHPVGCQGTTAPKLQTGPTLPPW